VVVGKRPSERKIAMTTGIDDVSDPAMPADDRTVVAQELSTDADGAERRGSRREVSLEPGDILNGIYRVDRFIARGGMGEVFEGVNVESDERVAIKAMRSHLAADPKVLAMFRKEAQVLIRIAHPAIVQYRVLARDPELELYYIVTDFIDGEPLSALLDGTQPNIAAFVSFARRLASGLGAAHDHGAIHRDMSPDNVLLPGGALERAKIIDFGIAKSLDVTAETVVGDGFAGKLGYVAPEQFGDFDRQVGPWTDVYSTALVLLAFLRGKAPDMGKTLSEAIERRREGPDLTNLPPAVEPLLRRMLTPDPRARLRSMTEVLVELDHVEIEGEGAERAFTGTPSPGVDAVAEPAPTKPAAVAEGRGTPLTTFLPVEVLPEMVAQTRPSAVRPPSSAVPRRQKEMSISRLWIGAVLAVLVIAGGSALLLYKTLPVVSSAPVSTPAASTTQRPVPSSSVAKPVAVAAMLRAMPCVWLRGAGEVPLRLSGGARDPGALDDQVITEARANGFAVQSVDSADVVQIPEARCDLVEVLRGLEPAGNDEAFKLVSATNVVTLSPNAPNCPSDPAARADLTAVENDPKRDFALFAILPGGDIHLLVAGRKQFVDLARHHPQMFQDLGDGRFQISACYSTAGAVGLILVDGPGPIDLGLRDDFRGVPPSDLAARVQAIASSQGWRARSVWLRIDPPADNTLVPASVSHVVPPPNKSMTPAPSTPFLRQPARTSAQKDPDAALRPAFKERAGATSESDFAACRLWDGERWKELGYSSRAICVERVFKNRCSISNGQFGGIPLRRYDGRIQMQFENAWTTIAKADGC